MARLNYQQSMQILLADDGSQHSLAAVALLCDLSLAPGSSISAVSVITPREVTIHEARQKALDQTKSILQDKGIEVETDLKLGTPADVLIQYADQINPDLIVMGAKGLRATLGILLGGVAQQVVEYANWPVLVVRAPYDGLRKVMLAVDGSVHSQLAVNYVTKFPFPQEIELHVVHVLPPLPEAELAARTWPLGPDMIPPMPPKPEIVAAWQTEEEKEGKLLLNDTVETFKDKNLKVKSVLARGDAATEMINYITAHKIDLVVMGSRGLSQVRGWLLGSVSRKLVHYASCSVMIVKGTGTSE